MTTITVHLTPSAHRQLLKRRGKERLYKAANCPLTPLARYWWEWQDIREEWKHVRCGKWQQDSVRRAYRQRLAQMRSLRLRRFA